MMKIYLLLILLLNSLFYWGLNYDITNKLQLSVYGQYMLNNSEDPFLSSDNHLSKTNAGSFLNYNPKENSKIGVGIEYQYDQRENKWKSEGKGRVSIGF